MSFRSIVKKFIPRNLFSKIEPTGHLIESVLVNIAYGFPSRHMHVIGVTGTNGKTTTTLMIQKMLHTAGYKAGVMSTVAWGYGDDIKQQIEHATTSSAPVTQRRLKQFKKAGVDWVVVETSSHSLAQHRVWGIPYEIAVLTNLTEDHLDYHGTFENYLLAKRRLFQIAAKHGRKVGIVNAEDPSSPRFAEVVPRAVSYGIKTGDVQATKLKLEPDHSTYTAVAGSDNYNIQVNIPGDFNVSNSLAVVAVGREVGLTKQQIEKGIAALKRVEGRMETIDEGQPFKVLIDFASTPDAFERFFAAVRPTVKGKLIVVFGSAGLRDEKKRPVQGEIAGKYADEVIITEEDDRTVDGEQIMKEIAAGAEKAGKKEGKNLYLVHNREEAIGFALTRAGKNDVVAFLGKGHEKTIERADGTYPWNEAAIVRAALQEFKSEASRASD